MTTTSGLTDALNVVQVLAPIADAFDATVFGTTKYLNMANYETMIFIAYWGVGATGTVTFTVNEATSSAGAGATAIPFTYRLVANTASSDVPAARVAATSAGYLTIAGSNQMVFIEVNALDLDSGNNWVGLVATEVVDSPMLGGVLAVMGSPRYAGATMITALT